MNEFEMISQAAATIVAIMIGYAVWTIKKLTARLDNTYNKQDVKDLIDLKLRVLHVEISCITEDIRSMDKHLERVERKIDKLLQK